MVFFIKFNLVVYSQRGIFGLGASPVASALRVRRMSLSQPVLEPCLNTSRYPWIPLQPENRQKHPEQLENMMLSSRMSVEIKRVVC